MDETTLEHLVGAWLPLPDVAERMGTDVGKVRRMLADGTLVAVRLGERKVLGVPERFLRPADEGWTVLPALAGTVSVLRDSGFADDEAVAWLFTPDPSLADLGTGAPTLTPVDALAAGHKTEIRRRAQALAI
ncbi:Rv2175c family DNA-binding protein [Actinotalea sp. M2MS4P-6]|uniref:Rv2175c family DNA-binding protein n=1 Tax=Actinotalea sp. M2MS4P-6 TaxID=2983762 RepID=UPI0021E38D66|nr:Rv2175c family DNA-binding protein [Actinotalea sp. M2MS4P-6]MCV2396471.1 Rv2175c family DNA-binding protein [Actinotalea sp. M2MS4P-6]